jgi:glycosyltransferase involved in cell wall biosynthesis
VYEYLAARRPILAAVPPNGTAAALIREAEAGTIVPPDDARAIGNAIQTVATRWRQTGLPDLELPSSLERRISRTERVRELAELLYQLVPTR